MDEQMLRDARRTMAECECAIDGHDYSHIVDSARNPVRLVCDRCGRWWAVHN